MPNTKPTKPIWASKTLWTQVVAVCAYLVQEQFGYVLDPQAQVYILIAVNVLLRTVTDRPIKWNLDPEM